MSLTLTSEDQQRFASALRAFTTLDVANPAAWEIKVLRALKPLVRAERAGFFYDGAATLPAGVSEDYDGTIQAAYRSYYSERDPGRQRVEARKDPVFSRAELFEADLEALLRSECYNDFLAPTKMGNSTGTALPGEGSGAAGVLALHRSDFGSEDFARTAPALLRMLYPAFVSGWRARRALDRQLGDLMDMVDALAEAVAICTPDGRLLHANPRLEELFRTHPRRGEFRSTVQRTAAARGDLLRASAPELHRDRLSGPSCFGFRLWATRVDWLLPAPAVLVTAEPVRARPPSTAELMKRFDLTRRQAEVAILLAERLSNREIAERLTISPHTALRHTEAVRRKLQVRDRRLVADRLRKMSHG